MEATGGTPTTINRYDAKAWEDIGLHMTITARLTSDESTALIDFLKIGAPRVASLEELERANILRAAGLINVVPPVRDPADATPPFAEVLSPQKIRELAGYLMELSSKETASR